MLGLSVAGLTRAIYRGTLRSARPIARFLELPRVLERLPVDDLAVSQIADVSDRRLVALVAHRVVNGVPPRVARERPRAGERKHLRDTTRCPLNDVVDQRDRVVKQLGTSKQISDHCTLGVGVGEYRVPVVGTLTQQPNSQHATVNRLSDGTLIVTRPGGLDRSACRSDPLTALLEDE